MMTWLGVVRDEVKTDLPFPELLRLALLANKVPPSGIRNVPCRAWPAAPAGRRWSASCPGPTPCSAASAPASWAEDGRAGDVRAAATMTA